MLIHDLLDEFELFCRSANRSPRTIAWYLQYASDFERFLIARDCTPDCERGTTRLLREYVLELQARSAPATVAGKVRALKGLFAFGARGGLLESDPSRLVPVPKIPQTDYITHDVLEVDRLLRACDVKTLAGAREFDI